MLLNKDICQWVMKNDLVKLTFFRKQDPNILNNFTTHVS